jgi:hypothetical protein
MKKHLSNYTLIVILTLIVIYFSANPQSAPIVSDLTLQKVLSALAGIFAFVLLVERFTEIIISFSRGIETDKKIEEISLLKEELSSQSQNSENANLETGTNTTNPDNQDKNKEEKLATSQKTLAKYQAETKKTSLLVSFALSIIICSAGVGLIGEIIDIKQGNQNFLRAVDIVLTSGLIAGGSDSFHQVVRAFETFFTESKKNMKES